MSEAKKEGRIPRGVFYIPIHHRYFLLLTTLFGAVIGLLFFGIIGSAFKTLFPNIGTIGTLTFLGACLLGSLVNIPITKLKSEAPIIRSRFVTVFGVTYPLPIIEMKTSKTLLAINLGGAIIPTIISIYLISKALPVIINIIVATAFVTMVVKIFARPVRGLGITIPGFIPPLAAILPSLLLGGSYIHIVAYISGTLGTLIGADLLNLHVVSELGTPIVSIGGAGTFDGVFLAGIIAVFLS